MDQKLLIYLILLLDLMAQMGPVLLLLLTLLIFLLGQMVLMVL